MQSRAHTSTTHTTPHSAKATCTHLCPSGAPPTSNKHPAAVVKAHRDISYTTTEQEQLYCLWRSHWIAVALELASPRKPPTIGRIKDYKYSARSEWGSAPLYQLENSSHSHLIQKVTLLQTLKGAFCVHQSHVTIICVLQTDSCSSPLYLSFCVTEKAVSFINTYEAFKHHHYFSPSL